MNTGDQFMICTDKENNKGCIHSFAILTAVSIVLNGIFPDRFLVQDLETGVQQFVEKTDLLSLEELKTIIIKNGIKQRKGRDCF